MRFFGIDLHHNNMVAAIIDEYNKIEVIRKTFHTPGFNDFLKQLKKDDYIAVEASTNTFWFYDQVVRFVSLKSVANAISG